MKHLIIIFIVAFYASCTSLCPECPEIVEKCDTAKFLAWANKKDAELKSRALEWADSVFAERRDSINKLHANYKQADSIALVELKARKQVIDSIKKHTNNILIEPDGREVKYIGYDSTGNIVIIWHD